MSDLRAHPFVVLLGEPGSGKSSVLQVEARHAGASVVTVRTLLNAGVLQADGTLFLDALDEYRIEGQDADKVQRLSAAISQTKARQWRLTCRSEDWRKRADLAALQHATGGSQIVVAKLLPLEPNESSALLLRFGEADPERFMAKAETLGAGSLLRSPLSLKLLHRVVSRDGKWPDSRFELFEAAAISLAHEDNDDYKFARRTPVANILAAAEETCLVYLVSGARAIWRSNSEPPRSSSRDSRAFLTAHDLQLEHPVVADMLDTALFTGEGEEFQPLHRTMAEYLAARALAKLLRGTRTRPAFPFARAVAMITCADAVPPSELRGLYAWFARRALIAPRRARASDPAR